MEDGFSSEHNRYIKFTKMLLSFIQRAAGVRIITHDEHKIPKDCAVLFLANHFTRFETFMLPYVINKIDNVKFSRSLADHTLFIGKLGEYLTSLGTLSVKNPDRDKIIIDSLSKNKENWIIYPEGKMMKDKKIYIPSLLDFSDNGMHTGAAVLAMKAEIARVRGGFSSNRVAIVPVAINYFPIRPSDNTIKRLVQRVISGVRNHKKALPRRLEEELLVEGQIMLQANIDIIFNDPIYVGDIIKVSRNLTNIIPLINDKTRDDAVINLYRHYITNKIARSIYENAIINLDHFIAMTIYSLTSNNIAMDEFYTRLFVNIIEVRKFREKYRIHARLLDNDEVLKIYLGHDNSTITDLLNLLEHQGIIIQTGDGININQNTLSAEYNMHEIRISNILKVLHNEVVHFSDIAGICHRNAHYEIGVINDKAFDIAVMLDAENARRSYNENFDSTYSKNIDVCMPFLLMANQNKTSIILLVHGYKASPGEMRELANALMEKGVNSYIMRLSGHGTSPDDMRTKTHEDWYNAVLKSYKMLKMRFVNVYICGFSTGGLLAVKMAMNQNVDGIICINAALKLSNIKFRFVKVAKFWSDISAHFSKDPNGFVEDTPEYPDTNYAKHYFSSMVELSRLMHECDDGLDKINCPVEIIQSSDDPIVLPVSGDIIYSKIKSESKTIVKIMSKKHVIVRGEKVGEIANHIATFIK